MSKEQITDGQWKVAARRRLGDDKPTIEIDADGEVNKSGDGAWVQAWVWVPTKFVEALGNG